MSKTEILHTKFGNAKLSNDNYYKISSGKEGNFGKLFHRLLWEDFYGCSIPDGYIIHHKNGDKTDNCILNLQLMRSTDHRKLHKSGKNHHQYGVRTSEKTKDKISKTMTTTGIKNVRKNKDKKYLMGFKWNYQYYNENGKRQGINSIDLRILKKKVLENGLEWIILDEEKANKCFEENKMNMKKYYGLD